MVIYTFLFQTGAIKTRQLAAGGRQAAGFLFQTGAIKTNMSLMTAAATYPVFLFQTGAIKTLANKLYIVIGE